MAPPLITRIQAATSALPRWTIVLLSLVALWSLLAINISQEYRNTQERAHQLLAHQVKFVDSNIGQQLQIASNALDLILKATWLKEEKQFNRSTANADLKSMTSLLSGIRTLLIVNANGQVIASNRMELIDLNMRGAERFKTILNNPNPELLYLSAPFETPLKTWAMGISKMIPTSNGDFNGYVMAILDPLYVQSIFQSILLSDDTRATLIHGDGKVVMRYPDTEGVTGQDLSTRPGNLFTLFKQSGRDRYMLEGTSAVSGKPSVIMYTTIRPEFTKSDKPLVFAVSREKTHIFAPWWRHTIEQLIAGVLLSALAIFLAYYRRQRPSAMPPTATSN